MNIFKQPRELQQLGQSIVSIRCNSGQSLQIALCTTISYSFQSPLCSVLTYTIYSVMFSHPLSWEVYHLLTRSTEIQADGRNARSATLETWSKLMKLTLPILVKKLKLGKMWEKYSFLANNKKFILF